MCILATAPLFLYLVPYVQQFSAVDYKNVPFENLHVIKRFGTETKPCNGAIWNEFSEHQSTKKYIQCQNCTFLCKKGANLMHIFVRPNWPYTL